MNRVQGVMKMHLRDRWIWFFTPFLVVLPSFLVNIIISYFVEEPIYTGGILSLYIYMLIAGAISLIQSFPFALGLSVRRTDYFAGTGMVAGAVCALIAVLLLLLSYVEQLTGFWGVDLHFCGLPYLNDGGIAEQLWVYFSILINMFFLGFFVSSIYRRFGKKGLGVFFVLLLILMTVCSYVITFNQWWVTLFHWLAGHPASMLASWAVVLTVGYAILSYFMLRKSTV